MLLINKGVSPLVRIPAVTTTHTFILSLGHLWLLVIIIMIDGRKKAIVKVTF